MESRQISWPLVMLYLLVVLGVGIWAARTKVSTMDDMAVAGRRSGLWLVAFSVAATWINGVTLISISGVAKNFGLAGYWTGASFQAATIWLGYYIVPRLREAQIVTIPQLFDYYFGVRTHGLSLILTMLRDLGATAGVMGALGVVTANLFDISVLQALFVTYGLMMLYLFFGGMWAVLVTDAIQFIIVFASSLWLAILALSGAGGLFHIQGKVPSEMLDVVGAAGAGQVVGWAVLGVAITLGYQSIIQRGLAASDHRVARQGFVIGGVIGIFWYMIPVLLGISARVIYGAEIGADEVFLRLAFDLGGAMATPIVISILAASMSTLDSTINTIASNFSIDIYARYLNRNASQRRLLWIYRFNILLVGLLAVAIYYLIPLMMELFWLGGRIMGASLSPVLTALVLFPRTRRAPKSVFLSMVVGGSAVLLWQIAFGAVKEVGTMVVIWSLDPILVGLPLSIVCLGLGTILETQNELANSYNGKEGSP